MNIYDIVKDTTPVNQFSPLVLAYAGDSVYEMYIRTRLVCEANTSVHNLHRRAIKFVKAKAQSDAVMNIMDKLTEEETAAYKRGRNAKSFTVPKNAEVSDYRHATGFEALVGYLYLSGNKDRLKELLDMVYDFLNV